MNRILFSSLQQGLCQVTGSDKGVGLRFTEIPFQPGLLQTGSKGGFPRAAWSSRLMLSTRSPMVISTTLLLFRPTAPAHGPLSLPGGFSSANSDCNSPWNCLSLNYLLCLLSTSRALYSNAQFKSLRGGLVHQITRVCWDSFQLSATWGRELAREVCMLVTLR